MCTMLASRNTWQLVRRNGAARDAKANIESSGVWHFAGQTNDWSAIFSWNLQGRGPSNSKSYGDCHTGCQAHLTVGARSMFCTHISLQALQLGAWCSFHAWQYTLGNPCDIGSWNWNTGLGLGHSVT